MGMGWGSRRCSTGPTGGGWDSGVSRAISAWRGRSGRWRKARRAAVVDPEFVSLPKPSPETRTLVEYHDPAVMDVSDDRLVESGWTIVNGALRTFVNSSRLAELAGSDEGLRRLGLILGGDVTILQERIAIVSSHQPRVQTDESTLISAFVTGMVEGHGAKGSGWSLATRLDDFTDEAGVTAAQAAIDAVGGERVPSGRYTVVFGHQPVADIMNNLIVPACNADAFYASATPFLGRLGQRVASPLLTIYDDGARPGLVGSKGITCEGLPTGRTDLIRDGALAGCLTNWYCAQRLLRDPALADKLGRHRRRGGSGAGAAQRLPLRRRRRSSVRQRGRRGGLQHRGRRSRADRTRRAVAAGRRRTLRRTHLVHLPDQRAARR